MNRFACLALITLSACGGKIAGLTDAGPSEDAGVTDAMADALNPPPPPLPDAQPPADAEPPPPPPGQCNGIALSGPLVPLVGVPQNPPSFLLGGPIPDGTYVLQKFVDYTGPNGSSSTLGHLTVTIQASGSTWQIASEQGQPPVQRLTVAVTKDSTTLHFSPVCGTSTDSSAQYMSSGGVLELISHSGNDTFVELYVRK